MRFVLIAILLWVATGCNCLSKARDRVLSKTPNQDSASPQDVYQGLSVHTDLLALAHLADFDQRGLWIDFGTANRMKYTGGNWKNGWLSDRTQHGVTFTHVGETGRVYFSVDEPTDLTLQLRIKPIGSQNLMLYLNNKALPSVQMRGSDFYTFQVSVPAGVTAAGENQLLMRFGGSQAVGGEQVSAAVDYIHVGRVSSANAGATPAEPLNFGKIQAQVGESKRASLVLPANVSATWYVRVPNEVIDQPDPRFGVGVSEVAAGQSAQAAAQQPALKARVVVTADGVAPETVWSQPIAPVPSWREQALSLQKWAGKVVRLELSIDAQGQDVSKRQVAWAEPRLYVRQDPKPNRAAELPKAKNVVVLLIDTLRADKLKPFHAASRVKTPALDAIAQEGTVFAEAQSPENWTKPSVASVLTSLYPMTHGAKTDEAKLPDRALMISEVLKKQGFRTSSFIANGYVSDKFGFNQGWDYYTNYIREGKSTKAEHVFNEAGNWIEKNKDKPFFVYIQTIDPHVPYDPPANYLAMYDAAEYTGIVNPRLTADQLEKAKRNPPVVTFTPRDRKRLEALYDGEISYHDEHMGKFVDRLKRLGLWDSTVFVLTADHGEEFYDHQSYGHGHTVYQELLHVPLLVRMPGRVPSGKRIADTVSTLDIAPTVLDTLGVAVPTEFEGKSLEPMYLQQTRGIPPVAFSDFLEDRRVVRAGEWKLILRGPRATFFNLAADPHEQRELDSKSYPIAYRYCRVLLGQFLGASRRGTWLQPHVGGSAHQLEQEKANVDETLRGQLKALGYAN
jgi:choline-sulfatase